MNTEQALRDEIVRLEGRLARVAAKSGRRKTAIKQLQKAHLIEQMTNKELLQRNARLSKEMYEWRAIARKSRSQLRMEFENEFRMYSWWYRLFGVMRNETG